MKSSRWVSVAVVLVVLVILFRNLRYLYAHNVGMGLVLGFVCCSSWWCRSHLCFARWKEPD